MTTRRSRPVQISDAPEHRSIPIDRIEHREVEGDDNLFTIEGYASTFEEYDMYGGPKSYGWIERIDPSAFDITLREKPDLHLLINHAGTPLARTKSGTCKLSADEHGLKVEATLDKRDPESMALFVKMERGDMDEMSFAFRVKAQEWKAADGFDDDNQSYRTITEISLHKGDVSVVNWGANDTTSVGIRALDAIRALAECDEAELAEIRSDDADLVIRAAGKLGEAMVKPVHIDTMIINTEAREAEGDPTEETTQVLDAAGDIAELLSEALAPFIKRIDELEAALAGTVVAEEVDEERTDEPEPVVTDEVVEDVTVTDEDSDAAKRLAEALAELGEFAEDGVFSIEAAEAFVD